jgi:hypothetical protein
MTKDPGGYIAYTNTYMPLYTTFIYIHVYGHVYMDVNAGWLAVATPPLAAMIEK